MWWNPSALRFEEIVERYWMSSGVAPVLPVVRALPIRFNRFRHYTTETFLLKEAGTDIEFMHRLLRDYFALRDLQPLLGSPDGEVRLQAVRSLGYQGDAAVDALADIVRNASLEMREAAAFALGRISSPEVEQHIETALADSEPRVRAAAVDGSSGPLQRNPHNVVVGRPR